MNAATYNRTRFGTAFTLADLPATWTGTDLLRSFDQDEDLTLSPSELARVDWAAFSQEVEAFHQQAGFSGKALDGKLGPATRKALQARLGGGAREVALRIGDLDLPRSRVPPCRARCSGGRRRRSFPYSTAASPLLIGRGPARRRRSCGGRPSQGGPSSLAGRRPDPRSCRRCRSGIATGSRWVTLRRLQWPTRPRARRSHLGPRPSRPPRRDLHASAAELRVRDRLASTASGWRTR